jgi:hypothetical protein
MLKHHLINLHKKGLKVHGHVGEKLHNGHRLGRHIVHTVQHHLSHSVPHLGSHLGMGLKKVFLEDSHLGEGIKKHHKKHKTPIKGGRVGPLKYKF